VFKPPAIQIIITFISLDLLYHHQSFFSEASLIDWSFISPVNLLLFF